MSRMAELRDMAGVVVGGRYRILNRVGGGGMGTIYTGEHVELGLRVAIKILRGDAKQDPTRAERFRREARAAAQIEHENVCGCIDVGVTPDGQLYSVMEWLKGEDLYALLRREGTLPWPRARAIILQVCRALAAAHARGIIHRDLKPSNLMLIRRGDTPDFLKIVDFGIAKRVVGETALGSLTTAGEVIGTVAYMAPEQAAADKIDHRVDVYSAGVILYQMLTGRLPFPGKKVREIVQALLSKPPPPLRVADPKLKTSDELEALFQQILHRDPTQRIPDMTTLHHALSKLPLDACRRIGAEASSASLTQQSANRGLTPSLSGAGSGALATLNTGDSPGPSTRGRWVAGAGVGLVAVAGLAIFVGAGRGAPSPTPTPSPPAAESAATPNPTPAATTPAAEPAASPTPEAPVAIEVVVPTPPPEPPPEPTTKVNAKTKKAFTALMKRLAVKVKRCATGHKVKKKSKIRVEVYIEAATGRVTSATPQGSFAGRSELGACVVDAAAEKAVRPAPDYAWKRAHTFKT